MPSPNIKVTAEPAESGVLVYGPQVAKTADDDPTGYVALALRIHNQNKKAAVHVNQLRVSFLGKPAVADSVFAVDVDIPPDGKASWSFATADPITIPHPAPPKIRLGLTCTGFDTPANTVLPLAPHKNAPAAGSYRFPARAKDLRLGEYWSGQMGHRGSWFAYDMGVMGWDEEAKAWDRRFPGMPKDKNDSYRAWGKPVYAMAAGTVVAFANDFDDIPPLTKEKNHDDNNFYIQHGTELVAYVHLKKGSLTKALMKVGATVKQGDLLGLVGNSGHTSWPHLHVEVVKPGGRPLLFDSVHVIEREVLDQGPDISAPWVAADDHCLPSVRTALWPEATAPTWYPPGRPEVALHAIPEKRYQFEYDRVRTSGYRLVWIDGYDVNGDTFFNAVFRPKNGVGSIARHGLSSAGYQAEFDKAKAKGFRPIHVESYRSAGNVRYAAIFVDSPGPAWTAYHDKSAAEHQALFNDLTSDGWVPVNISPVSLSGELTYAALYEKRKVGEIFAKSFLTPEEYQTAYDKNAAAGRRLVYLNAYTHGKGPRIAAIWHEDAPATADAQHGMTSDSYQATWEAARKQGFLTRCVTGYEQKDAHRFAAFWTK